MAQINVQQQVINQMIADGNRSNLHYYDIVIDRLDLDLYDFTSSVDAVNELGIETKDRLHVSNCSDVQQQSTQEREVDITHEFEWRLAATIGYSQDLSAEVSIPELGKYGEKTTWKVDFTGSLSHKDVTTVKQKLTVPIAVPKCSTLEALIQVSNASYSGTFDARFLAKGTAHGRLKVDWWRDPEVSLVIRQLITVSGTFSGISGKLVSIAYNQTSATCPPGSPCNPVDTGKGGGSSGATGAGGGGSADGGSTSPTGPRKDG